jgi:hypothetical protein
MTSPAKVPHNLSLPSIEGYQDAKKDLVISSAEPADVNSVLLGDANSTMLSRATSGAQKTLALGAATESGDLPPKKKRVRRDQQKGDRPLGVETKSSNSSPGAKKRGRDDEEMLSEDEPKRSKMGDEHMEEVVIEEPLQAGPADRSCMTK